MEERALRRRSWPVFAGIAIAALWGVYPWTVDMNLGRGDYADLWRITALWCATSAFFLRLGTCVVVLRAESLVVINPIGSKEVRYDAIRKVVAGPASGLKMETARDERLAPAVFGGSLLDYRFATSESAADEIRRRMPRKPRPAALAEPVRRQLVRPCRSADLFLATAVVSGIVGEVLGLAK